MKNPKLPFEDIKNNFIEIEKRVTNLTLQEFKENFEVNRVIKYCFLELCEALNQLRKIIEIEDEKYKEYIYLANRLKHNYWVNRDEILYRELISSRFKEFIKSVERDVDKYVF